MDFTSARFTGNALLKEILNDPDTGTRKLAPGSPAHAVVPVQRALLDLRWVERFVTASGTVLVPEQFVDGDYGGWTSKTALAYKTNYRIAFPGAAGFDGFTGPRTLKALDQHCTLLDEADDAIIAHTGELLVTGAVSSLDLAAPDGAGRTTTPIRQSPGAFRSAVIDGEVGAVVFKRGLGAFALHGPLFVRWSERELASGTGNATGSLGFPVADMFVSQSGASLSVERGTLTLDAASGVITEDIDPGVAAAQHDIEF